MAHFHFKFKTQLNLAIFENCYGHPYVAYCNGQWCRVLLEKMLPNQTGIVLCVDIGNRQTMELDKLKELPER